MQPAEIRTQLAASLPPAHWARLEQVRQLANAQAWPAYLAGGVVRDLLLRRPISDVDFVVVPAAPGQTAPRLARQLAEAHGGAVTVHAAFGTATWLDPAGTPYDFATARTETYAHPGALPTVMPVAHMQADLQRRDFTINAMALRLDGEHFGALLDPFGGQADLAARTVCVLHAGSFQDDPTRLFRAVRYAQRLDFRLAPETEVLIARALPVMAALSGERVRHELELAFRETRPSAVLQRLEALGALAAAHPALHWGPSESADAQVVPELPRPSWQWSPTLPLDSIYLALLLRLAGPAQRAAALDRLAVSRPVYEAVTGALALSPTGTRPSEVVAQLDPHSLDAVVAAYAARPEVRERLDAFLARWRFIRAKLTGDDLVALGLTPGPAFKRILARLRAARLDDEVHDTAGELMLVHTLARAE